MFYYNIPIDKRWGLSTDKIKTRITQIYFLENAAVRKRIAAFFYSTQFHIIPDKRTIKYLGAAGLQRLCLFFVVKSPYMTFYCSRAPPSNLESHKKFKIWRFHMIIKYDFLSKVEGEIPEVEVDESLGKLMEQMDAYDFNLNRAETRRHIYMSQL